MLRYKNPSLTLQARYEYPSLTLSARFEQFGDSPMKIGMNLLMWSGQVTEADFPTLEKLKAAGFDGVELPLFGGTIDEAKNH